MVGNASGSTGPTAGLNLDPIEEWTILLLLLLLLGTTWMFLFLFSVVPLGSTGSNDDSLLMVSLVGGGRSINVKVVVVVIAPSTEIHKV